MPSLLGRGIVFYERVTDNNNMVCRFLKRHCIHIDRNTIIHRIVHGALFVFSVANVIGSFILACNTFAMICNYGSARVGVLVVTIMTLYFCQIVLLTIAEYIIVIFPRDKEIKDEESSSGESGAEELPLQPLRQEESVQGPSARRLSSHGPSVRGQSPHKPSDKGPSSHGPSVRGPSPHEPSVRGPSPHGPSVHGPSAPAPDEMVVKTVKCEEHITSIKSVRDSYKLAVKHN